jgi:hypothetical protein
VVKTAVIIIQLVPESENVENIKLKKQIIETLRCDWLLDVLTTEITESKNPEQKQPEP